MNKHIRLLIENITDDIFNDDLFNTDDTYTTISNDIFCSYHPKTNEELRKLLGHLFVERGKDADLNDIDVSNITDMSNLFKNLNPPNIDIRYWDVSNVENMSYMFSGCTKFTGKGLGNWNPIKCKNMTCMFYDCSNFDCDLSDWDVRNVKMM